MRSRIIASGFPLLSIPIAATRAGVIDRGVPYGETAMLILDRRVGHLI